MKSNFFATTMGIVVTGALIGVLAIVLQLNGNPPNMGICVACFERDMAGAIGLHRAAIVQYLRPEIIGIVLGAMVSALAFHEFKGRAGSAPATRFVLGLFVMIGALVFLGCPLRMVIRLGGGDLTAVAGLLGFLAGILAATMSTADSQLLVAASGVSENIIQDFLGIKLSEKKSLSIARITILVISVVGVFLARDPNSSVFGIVSFAWAGMGAAFAGVMICALFWKRTTLQGALAGMISGGAMVFIWKYAVRPMGGILDIYELLPAFLVSLAMIIIVSLATKAPSQEILDEFESVNAKK